MVEGNIPHIDLPPTSEGRTQYRPAIIVISGVPLTGKSTLMERLTQKTNIVGFDVDRQRFSDPSIAKAVLAPNEERLAVESSYTRVFERSKEVCEKGKPAAIAGVFSRSFYHDLARVSANDASVPLKIVQLEPPTREEVQRRLRKRAADGSFSNITTVEQFEEVLNRYQPFPEDFRLIIPQGLTLEQQVEIVRTYLHDLQVAA